MKSFNKRDTDLKHFLTSLSIDWCQKWECLISPLTACWECSGVLWFL